MLSQEMKMFITGFMARFGHIKFTSTKQMSEFAREVSISMKEKIDAAVAVKKAKAGQKKRVAAEKDRFRAEVRKAWCINNLKVACIVKHNVAPGQYKVDDLNSGAAIVTRVDGKKTVTIGLGNITKLLIDEKWIDVYALASGA